jgi:type II restriction enzyme
MASPFGAKAIEEALKHGRAILKYISRNDVGLTGSHQGGFYLPKAAWRLYTTHPPTKGLNAKTDVEVIWQDDRTTQSCVTWYGTKTRSEYRLTRFGKDFPWLTPDSVGSLLVVIPATTTTFLAYVLDLGDDIEEIQAALGVEVIRTWAIYEAGVLPQPEKENECINRHFRKFTEEAKEFPSTGAFADEVRRVVAECVTNFSKTPADDRLLRWLAEEYDLFRMVERSLCQSQMLRLFEDVDDFLKTASSIMNRRKARAGRSLERHFEYLLQELRIPYSAQPRIDGNVQPDILIPGKQAYEDPNYPVSKLMIIGVKTTCKDRWRQVLSEAKRIPAKHILTIQPGISANQLEEMHKCNVRLIVPKRLHKEYPKESATLILGLEQFLKPLATVPF